MSLKVNDNIRDGQSLCEDQRNSSQHPLVELNAALHLFYEYLMALQQAGFITEDEQTAVMEKRRSELLAGMDRLPIVTNAQGKSLDLNWTATSEEIRAAMREVRRS